MTFYRQSLISLLAASSVLLASYAPDTDACTRVMYKGPEQTILTGRSMDFSLPIPANLWILPRGISRSGEVGANSIAWTAKYGSLVVSSWDIASSDGMNEKGLVANMLWLVESEYPSFSPKGTQPGLSISLWAQYVLDNFASVAEAVAALREEPFVVVTDVIPGTDKHTTIHLSVSDASGDNAIFEYIAGKLVIHHDPSYTVMTNDPPYQQQLAIQQYWQGIPGNQFLPGTVKAADRFVRAHYYINSIPQTSDPLLATASVFSVIRNTSVPYGYQIEGYPNLSSTQWRVVADHKHLRYFFETALTPNTFWVDLTKLDFRPEAGAKVLYADKGQVYAGESSAYFVAAEPFKFQGLDL